MESFSLECRCETAALRLVRQSFGGWVTSQAQLVGRHADILLAVHEAAANAIEHAHPCEAIEVTATLDGSELRVCVADRGSWAERTTSDGTRGRGTGIMRDLADTMEVVRNGAGTTTVMRFSDL